MSDQNIRTATDPTIPTRYLDGDKHREERLVRMVIPEDVYEKLSEYASAKMTQYDLFGGEHPDEARSVYRFIVLFAYYAATMYEGDGIPDEELTSLEKANEDLRDIESNYEQALIDYHEGDEMHA